MYRELLNSLSNAKQASDLKKKAEKEKRKLERSSKPKSKFGQKMYDIATHPIIAKPMTFVENHLMSIVYFVIGIGAICLLLTNMLVDAEKSNYENRTVSQASPIVDYKTVNDAEKASGITIDVPNRIDNYKVESASVLESDNKVIQVNYLDKYSNTLTIRKSKHVDKTTADISGDYNDYDSSFVNTQSSNDVKYESNDTKTKASTVFELNYSKATWTSNGYDYSVSLSKELPYQTLYKAIESIK